MHRPAKYLAITVSLPPKDRRSFVSAACILRRLMGKKAPTALKLIQHNLTERDPDGIADDYLDCIGFLREVTARPASRNGKPSSATSRQHSATPMRLLLPRVRLPVASGRN